MCWMCVHVFVFGGINEHVFKGNWFVNSDVTHGFLQIVGTVLKKFLLWKKVHAFLLHELHLESGKGRFFGLSLKSNMFMSSC